MNRRGHLSHKIPNVKLRPAPASTTNSSSTSAAAARGGGGASGSSKRRRTLDRDDEDILRRAYADAEDEEASSVAMRLNNRPWKSVTITFTGIDNKGLLAPLVKELGGSIESALTVHVTHVVATGPGSAKYDYAIMNGLPVMSPSWIIDAHTKWLDGEELDLESSVKAHQLQPLVGCKIAISGIDNIERRKEFIAAINDHGGVYSKDLDRSCTHLISAFQTDHPKARASEKVKWALREIASHDNMRRDGRKFGSNEEIMIVYEEWLWDCVSLMGRFKEDRYDARNPRPTALTEIAKANGAAVAKAKQSPKAPTEADSEYEPAVMKKRKRDSMGSLVGQLLSTSVGDKSTNVDLPTASISTSGPLDASEALLQRTSAFQKKSSILHSSRSDSFSAPSLCSRPSGSKEKGSSLVPSSEENLKDDGQMFQGLRFSHVVAEGYQGLEAALVRFGGTLVSDHDRLKGADVDYIITRLALRVVPEMVEGKTPIVVTECWVEGCCYERKLLDPNSKLFFRPLSIDTPISDLFRFSIHISGFSTEDTVYLRRLLKALGGTLAEKLNRSTTHLVCAAPKGLKYEKAQEWGVRIVKQSWLLSMAQSGNIELEDEHQHLEDGKGSTETIKPETSGGLIVQRPSTGLISAASIAPNLEDDINVPSLNIPSQTSVPPASGLGRGLQPTPTHVDEIRGSSSSSSSSNKKAITTASAPTAASLSNDENKNELATRNRNGTSENDVKNVKLTEKILRTVSAPADPSSSSRSSSQEENGGDGAVRDTGLKAATVAVVGRREGVTEALRLLAERGGDVGSGRQKITRRRPFSRPKTSLSNSHSHSRLTSPDDRRSSSPIPPEDHRVLITTAPGGGEGEEGDGMAGDESMKVTYGDDKERRRLIEAVMKGASIKEKALEEERDRARSKTESPMKRTRR